ncbi:Ig domain-containing protein [Duganella sp. Dugasp56]|uniref:Ig domain-containing protein n=1 Tax=Duganella sp. Dugasp56 TaxID=3243046 RepID=UPI0039AF52CE
MQGWPTPPAISDLNNQIEKLKAAEKALRDTLDSSTADLLQEAHVRWHDDDKLIAARLAFSHYLEEWAATKTIVESTLGRLVPEGAENFKPPYRIPNQLLAPDGQLRSAVVDQPYSLALVASGGRAPYTWTVDAGALPGWLTLDTNGTLSGTPTISGTFSFTVTVTDAGLSTRIKEFILPVSPAPVPNAEQRFRPTRRTSL